MKSDFLIAVTQLAAERRLPREAVISAIEAALASAYKKDSLLAGQEISVSLNPANGELKLFTHKITVQKVEDPQKEISLTEARKVQRAASLGDTIEVESDLQNTGRIAAQTAKQVVLQRLREAERELVYEEYVEKEGDIVTGTVQRMDARQVILDLGRTEAILPTSEQVVTERYRPGQKIKVHVAEVHRRARGPEIVVSRASKELLHRLFEVEVPEIYNGIVEIKNVAREAGSRSKVAVYSRQEGVDPVGSCVGLRGIRIQNIVNELQGEKIDVVQWHPDLGVFLANALSPCPVTRVELGAEDSGAIVVVPDRHLSLAIGKEGQNARLCAKLSGLMVNIKSVTEAEEDRIQRASEVTQHVKDVEEVLELSAEIEGEPILTEVTEALAPEIELAVGLSQDTGSSISIEEQLADATLEVVPPVENGTEEISVVTTEIPDTVWNIPQVPQEPQRIRFAEDIMTRRPNAPGEGRRRGRSTRGGDEEAGRYSRKSRRGQYPIDDVDDDEPDHSDGLDDLAP